MRRKRGINLGFGTFPLRSSTPSSGWCSRSGWRTKITEKKSMFLKGLLYHIIGLLFWL
jgi:hypothetical protein